MSFRRVRAGYRVAPPHHRSSSVSPRRTDDAVAEIRARIDQRALSAGVAEERRPLLSRARALLPFGLVLVLLSLVVLQLVTTHRTESLRARISTLAEPARALVTEIQNSLALDIASTRAFLLTGDAAFAATRARAKGARDDALARLLPLGEELGADITGTAHRLRADLRPADLLLDSLFEGRISRQVYLAHLDAQQSRFRSALSAMATLDNEIARAAARSRSDIRATDRISTLVTALLVVLALVVALLVERLSRGYRVLLTELGESEERFRQIAEASPNFIWLADSRLTRQFYANTAYERIWGRERQHLYENPSSLFDGVHPDDASMVADALSRLPEGAFDLEFRIVRPDGQQRWVWSRGFPVRNEHGHIYRIAGISEDITERKLAALERERLLQRETEARRKSEEATAAAEARRQEVDRVTESRTRLIRGFTHDVKNPLGAADGFLALLEDGAMGALTPKQSESVQRIRRSVNAALGLIGHLLDLARIEAGQLEIHREEVDVRATAREVSEDFRAAAESKGLAFVLEDAPSEPLTLHSDRARVRQILSNLVSNAVKYTPHGGSVHIRVEPRHKPDARDADWVAIDVADTGPGVSPEQQKTLFDEFSRFDAAGVQGSGIGLAISERIARALDAALTVKSSVGDGSTFTLWLPAGAAA